MTAMDEHNIKSVATTHWPVCVKERLGGGGGGGDM